MLNAVNAMLNAVNALLNAVNARRQSLVQSVNSFVDTVEPPINRVEPIVHLLAEVTYFSFRELPHADDDCDHAKNRHDVVYAHDDHVPIMPDAWDEVAARTVDAAPQRRMWTSLVAWNHVESSFSGFLPGALWP